VPVTTENSELLPIDEIANRDEFMAYDESKSEEKWLSSAEARKELHISDCHLMHLRESGAVRFKKRGNAYLYAADDVRRNLSKSRRQ